MGFLSGFGEGLQKSAALEQQAQIQKKAELAKAQLKLADVLIGSQDPDLQAQGFAIYSDPSHPFSLEKPHPNLEGVQNVLQALGPGAAGKAVASGDSPPGMIGMLNPENSPLVQSGIIGDQGSGEPLGQPPPGPSPMPAPPAAPPAPPAPLPPQPAAMTTNPPATQGGTISPLAAAPPPPPAGIAPVPPPPAPPDEVSAAIANYQQASEGLPKPGLSSIQQETYYKELLQNRQTLNRAKALQAAGASKAEIAATLGGHDYTQVATTKMKEEGKHTEGEANRAAHMDIAGFKAKAQAERDAVKYEEQSRQADIKFAHAKFLKSMGVATGASKDDLKVTWHEIPDPTDPNGMRTVKVPITNATARDMAAKGTSLQSKIPATVVTRGVSAVAADKRLEAIQKDLPQLIEHLGPVAGQISSFEDLVGSEDPVVRKFLTDRAQVAAYMTSMHGARGIGLMREFENSAGRLKDNPEAFAVAISSLRTGTQDFLDTIRTPQLGNPPPTAPGSPKIGDTKTFKSGRKGRWDGTGWVAI